MVFGLESGSILVKHSREFGVIYIYFVFNIFLYVHLEKEFLSKNKIDDPKFLPALFPFRYFDNDSHEEKKTKMDPL